MAGEEAVPLDRLCEAIVDCEHKTAPIQETGIPSVRTTNIKNGRIDFDSCNRVSLETYEVWTQRLEPRPGDLILAREAPVGEVGMIPCGQRACLGQRTVLIRTDKQSLNSRYLLYLLLTPDMRHEVVRRAEGSTVPHLNMSDIRRLPIPNLPPLVEQQAIAAILGALDDKIELNRRMNRTLEEMARAIFKSWFVDFDPVREKAAGSPRPGLAPHIAALFPNSFTDSPLGPIPAGWEVSHLSDCVDVARGLSYNGSGLDAEGLPMHNLNSVYEGGGYKHEGIKHYTGEYKSKHVAKPGDVIVANTEQGHDRLLIGFAAIIPSLFAGECLFSHHLYRMRPSKASALTPDYLCHLFNTPTMHGIVSGYANGTTVNMLPIDALQRPRIIVPPAPLVAHFNGLATAARSRCDLAIAESRTLAALRDALLPKLLSGALRIPDAERIVGLNT